MPGTHFVWMHAQEYYLIHERINGTERIRIGGVEHRQQGDKSFRI